MSMNPEQEDFQQLRRLLALKRHEQPPPGYFNGFSSQVILRIRAGERPERDSLGERLLWQVPWLQQFWASLSAKPALAGSFGVLVCGLLITGAIYSERPEPEQASIFSPSSNLARQDRPGLMTQLSSMRESGVELSSTAGLPTIPRENSLFEEIRRTPQWNLPPEMQPVVERISLGQ